MDRDYLFLTQSPYGGVRSLKWMSTESQHTQTAISISILTTPSVVSTLLRRAQNKPSTQKGKREETRPVKAVLWDNNYPSSFINSCERSLWKLPADQPSNGFVVLSYVQGISERIGRILRKQQIKVAFKPLRTVNSLFPRTKAREKVDRPQSGIVYRISCTSCSFVYYGQTERPLMKTRITEHKRAVAMFDHDSKISCHVHQKTTKWILEVPELLDTRLIFMNDSSRKSDFL